MLWKSMFSFWSLVKQRISPVQVQERLWWSSYEPTPNPEGPVAFLLAVKPPGCKYKYYNGGRGVNKIGYGYELCEWASGNSHSTVSREGHGCLQPQLHILYKTFEMNHFLRTQEQYGTGY